MRPHLGRNVRVRNQTLQSGARQQGAVESELVGADVTVGVADEFGSHGLEFGVDFTDHFGELGLEEEDFGAGDGEGVGEGSSNNWEGKTVKRSVSINLFKSQSNPIQNSLTLVPVLEGHGTSNLPGSQKEKDKLGAVLVQRGQHVARLDADREQVMSNPV